MKEHFSKIAKPSPLHSSVAVLAPSPKLTMDESNEMLNTLEIGCSWMDSDSRIRIRGVSEINLSNMHSI